MDYLIGFVVGYYWHRFIKYLRKISDNFAIQEHEWDWFYTDDNK